MRKPLLALAVLLGAGCNPRGNDDRSAVILTSEFKIDEGTGLVGYFSDVVDDLGNSTDDFVTVEVNSIPKDINNAGNLHELYAVDFRSYTVSFVRADGRNEPGIDVPFPFTLPIGGSVPAGGNADLELISVTREQKIAQPLRGLFFSENQRMFATLNLTLFGRDRVDNNVSTSASVVVVFGDF